MESQNTSNFHLELKNITKIYSQSILSKPKTALKDFSYGFVKGECTGLLGHNGAGKTTTIRVIFDFVKANRGKVIFNNQSMTSQDRHQIGYMPEINKLPLNLTPFEVLFFQLKLYHSQNKNLKKKQTELVNLKLKEVGLWESKDIQIRFLSKGMGRRLAWAQATIHDPSLMILDEPFSGMDPIFRQEISNWISKSKEQKKTILLCSHELESVLNLCENFIILKSGELVYSKTKIHSKSNESQNESTYGLHLIGNTHQIAKDLTQKYQLPKWTQLEQSGYLLKLKFNSYIDSTKWLSSCLSEGYIVPFFGEEKSISTEKIMKFF